MIVIKNLTKKYGKTTAVEDFSFTFEKGKIYGLLGSNGAGKSTIMNSITGYLAVTDGSVIICGNDIQKNPTEAKKNIGYLPEIPPLYSSMTVGEYLMFVAELKKVAKDDRDNEVMRVMKEFNIDDVEMKLIKNLSKGYKQRVGMAQALIGNPEVVIFDEPTVGLDPKQIVEVRAAIKALKKNHTVILSSHLLSEVNAVCDQVLIISKGKLIVSDTPENLKKSADGGDEILISIVGKPEKAITALRKLKNIEKVENIGKDSDGHNRIKVTASAEKDIREEISITLAEKKVAVVEMVREEKSLEDIFLKLTSDREE